MMRLADSQIATGFGIPFGLAGKGSLIRVLQCKLTVS
jgi:hypothetical protein